MEHLLSFYTHLDAVRSSLHGIGEIESLFLEKVHVLLKLVFYC
jgi:hypothetical protein